MEKEDWNDLDITGSGGGKKKKPLFGALSKNKTAPAEYTGELALDELQDKSEIPRKPKGGGIGSFFTPRNDLYYKTLQASDMTAVEYLIDNKKIAGGAAPRIIIALLGAYGLQLTGDYEIDQQVVNFATERMNVIKYDIANIILSTLNSIEVTLDFLDHKARKYFIRDAEAKGKDVGDARSRLFWKRSRDYSTTIAMIVAHVIAPEYKLQINAAYFASEMVIETPFFGSSTFKYLYDLYKSKQGFLTVILLFTLAFMATMTMKDVKEVGHASVDMDYMKDKALPAYKSFDEYNGALMRRNDDENKWVKMTPKHEAIASQSINTNFTNAKIQRKDVVEQDENYTISLYTIKTENGVIMRVLSFSEYSNSNIELLNVTDLVGYHVNRGEGYLGTTMEELDRAFGEPTAQIFIPEPEQAQILQGKVR